MATDTQRPTGRRRKTMQSFTVDHWRAYTEKIILDTDDYWEVEAFQVECMKPILAGVRETWIVIPEANTKTTLMAAFGLYHLDFTRFPWVPILASSRDQAEIMATQAYDMIRRTGWEATGKYKHDALRRFRIYEGYRRIQQVKNGGRGLKVYAADQDTGDGGIPTLVLCDELHRWVTLGTYRMWKGKLRKRDGQIAAITTAGEPGGEFEEQREGNRQGSTRTVRRGSMTRYEAPNLTMIEWMVREPEKISDMREVKKANPFSGITEESLREEFNSPTTDIGDWKRLKPLAVDTPIPTPEGWSTMLELEVGDQVLNGEGLPTTVQAVTPVRLDKVYELEFNDGAKIVASGDHLWEVEDARNHYQTTVRSTEEMAEYPYVKDAKGRPYSPRWRIPLAGRHVSPAVELPIDPYVLGVWLGDGTSITGRVTNVESEVWEKIQARGYELGPIPPSRSETRGRVHTVYRLTAQLRAAGLLGAKHIPSVYLAASEEERWELLQGLIDTDGTVLEDGRVIFWNTNVRLANDVQRLVWSLGRPCLRREDRAILNGVDHGPRFAVEIPCDSRHPVARVPRKVTRLRKPGRKDFDHRRVRSITPVGNELVRCIAVDAADSIFLAGEAMIRTHNCNLPSRTISAAITDTEWDRRCVKERISEGAHVVVGYDVAWKIDTTALVPLWEAPEHRLIDLVRILVPPRDGSTMHPDAVKLAFEEIMEVVTIDFVVVDMERAEDVCAWLADEHHIEVVDHTQGNEQAAEDYDAFMKALRSSGRLSLCHTDDPGDESAERMLANAVVQRGSRPLRQHVMNAIARRLPSEKKRFDRQSQSRAKRKQQQRVIDGLTAAAMANQFVDSQQAVNDEPLVAWAGGDTHTDAENPWAPRSDESLPQSEMPFIG